MNGSDPSLPNQPVSELSAEDILPPERKQQPYLGPARGPDELGWIADYRALRIIGSGGMGIVFEAEDPGLSRRVAIKVLRPELAADLDHRERFLREARSAAGLSSDHVVTVHQVGESGMVPFLVMEFLHGESLQTRFERQHRTDVTLAMQIARDTARGLMVAHARGMIHRDIKPANLWLETDGPGGRFRRVKILDFGLARRFRGDTSLTATGLIVGTPNYMAPEQAAGVEIDERVDLFGLGCVLYTILAGELPFQGDSAMAVMMALAMKSPPPLHTKNPDVPLEVSELVERLLSKEPKDRPQSAEAVVEIVEGILAQLPGRIPTPVAGLPSVSPRANTDTLLSGTSSRTIPGGLAASLQFSAPSMGSSYPVWWAVLRALGVLAALITAVVTWLLLRPKPTIEPPSKATSSTTGHTTGVYWGGLVERSNPDISAACEVQNV